MLLMVPLLASAVPTTGPPVESPDRDGPGSLSGWVLNYDVLDYGSLPTTLVIARRGKIVRRISGDPFVWRWMFAAGGKSVAFESGPLHSGMECVLVDISSGRTIAQYDCFQRLSDDAPAWVSTLETRQPDREGH
jgi:hypothetical protein